MAEAGSSTRRGIFAPGRRTAAIVKKPVAVYVEKVYEQGDFSGLGIET